MIGVTRTAQGQLQGSMEDGLFVFRGVRYAQAPLGQLRFRAPQAPESWQGVRSAEAFGTVAPQIYLEALEAILGGEAEPQAEDCLFLNLWTPGLDDARRPVLVWIHGGGFTIGSGSGAYYDGGALATRGDVVVVTINYRLGALGFLHLPALGETNFGMRDQAAALRWVRDNIANFGGDPNNVTIAGESAGGNSVATLMASPEAAGLFHKAIPQSGAGRRAATLAQAESHGRRIAAALGVDPADADGLRRAPVEAVVAAQAAIEAESAAEVSEGKPPGPGLCPVIDGEFLTSMPIEAARSGQAAGIATLVGTLDEEWKLFTAMFQAPDLDEETVVARLDQLHGDGRRAYDGYRAASIARGENASPSEIADAASGDVMMRIPALRLASAQAQHNSDTYLYVFDWKSPMADGALGSCHGLDIPFVFGTHGMMPEFAGVGPGADALADFTMDAWLAFVRTGDPSSEAFQWHPYDDESQPVTVLGANPRTEYAWRADEVSLWDGVL